MADEELRHYEREKDRDPQAFARWIAAKHRAGLLPLENIQLASALGSIAAHTIAGGRQNIWVYLNELPRTKHARFGLAICYLVSGRKDEVLARRRTELEIDVEHPNFFSLLEKVKEMLEAYLIAYTGLIAPAGPHGKKQRAQAGTSKEVRKQEERIRAATRMAKELMVECQQASHRTMVPTEAFLVQMSYCLCAALVERWGSMLPRELASMTVPAWVSSKQIQVWERYHMPTHLMISAYEYLIRLFSPVGEGTSNETMVQLEVSIREALIGILLNRDV